ncbi:MAG TPA: DUF2946 family protein [Rhodocyclaceae bacterium]|nr:DUF2946 family protein [Rhodocyclaceae bacterium]
MDSAVQAALAKWPNVPACYGWLSLDRRGQWRLQSDPVRHAGLIAFMNSNYGCDEQGNWFVQNGPQKVYVTLEYTPWVLRLETDGRLETHTGLALENSTQALLDEEGNLLLICEHGVGLLDDRDLPTLLGQITDRQRQPADEDNIVALLDGRNTGLFLALGETLLTLKPTRRNKVPAEFGFVAKPEPPFTNT